GGDRIERAERDLSIVEKRLEAVREARRRFDEAAAELGEEVTTEKAFRALVARAQRALADPKSKASVRDGYADARGATNALRAQVAELTAERGRAAGLRGNIPSHLHEAREVLARAAGLTPEELPFVGELVE